MCGGKVDFIDERDAIVGSHLTAPFNLPAHLACELVPSNLSSFFNRRLIGHDFRFDADVPTCPDYEYWARLGFRFPDQAFKRYDVSVAQAYRTRDSMSFRAESFTQFSRDKLAHLDGLLAKGYGRTERPSLRPRSAAGIHMWAAEQLAVIEPGHPDILAHCAAAANYDKTYGRIARFVGDTDNAHYDTANGWVKRNVLGPRAVALARYASSTPSPDWDGAAIVGNDPLTLQTASAPWGYSLKFHLPSGTPVRGGGQYWARFDLEVISGAVGISLYIEDQLIGERMFRQGTGRSTALIPFPIEAAPDAPLMVRGGGTASSVVRIQGAELACDPDRSTGRVAPIEIER